MINDLDLAKCREQYPGLARQVGGQPAVFLDGPGGSQVPQSVIDAVADCLAHRNANTGGPFATSQAVDQIVDEAHQAVARLLGANDPDEIVFGQNMTTLTFALSRSLAKTWQAGDEVIVTRLDHDANVSPWVLAAQDAGVTVRSVNINHDDCTLRLDELESLMTERTRLIAVGLASNAVGTINPIRAITTLARRVGALVCVDAVHAVPHLRVDVAELGADFVVCSPYKFFGPHQGVLWGKREHLERLPAYKVRPAGDAIPGRWMTGTPNFAALAGTRAAVDYLTSLSDGNDLQTAYAAIRRHETRLAEQFLNGIAQQPDWRVWGITDMTRIGERVATFGLTHRTRSPQDIAEVLGAQGIFVWHGHFYAVSLIEALGLAPAGMLRIGFLHYNTPDEVSRLLDALSVITPAHEA